MAVSVVSSLMQIPLFTGMSREELEAIVEKTKFGFRVVEPHDAIANAGERCRGLMMITGGKARRETTFGRGFRVVERQRVPAIVQPERVFGPEQQFTSTFIAETKCSTLLIDKNELQRLLAESTIFRINLVNIIASAAQKNWNRQWQHSSSTKDYGGKASLERRIATLLVSHCANPSGEVACFIKMQQLADELNTTRNNISQSLHYLSDQSLLTIAKGKIIIPAMDKLLAVQ